MSVDVAGAAVLNDPLRNRGTAYTADERRKLGLETMGFKPVYGGEPL